MFFFYCYGDHRDLHVLTHSFPTRRSSDLQIKGLVVQPVGVQQGGAARGVHRRLSRHRLGGDFFLCPSLLTIHAGAVSRSEEHTSELQSLMRISYAVFCLKKKKKTRILHTKIQNKLIVKHTKSNTKE